MNEIIIASFPLIGVFIGALSGVFGSYLANKNKLTELDQKFKQNQELELRLQYLKRLEQYSKILQADGEHSVGEFDFSNGIERFNFEVYKEHLRPLIFECLHILDEDVIKSAREIDKEIYRTALVFPGEFEIHQMELAGTYFQLIKMVEQHVFNNSYSISNK